MKASPILEITPEVRDLAYDMIETMITLDASGLAACQVGVPIALFVTCVEPDGSSREGVHRVYLNPKILWYSSEKQYEPEGCMSIPKCYVYVERPLRVGIQAMDLDGKTFELTLEKLGAANFCHENDHLNGVLNIDRIDPKQRKEIEGKLRAIKAKYSSSP